MVMTINKKLAVVASGCFAAQCILTVSFILITGKSLGTLSFVWGTGAWYVAFVLTLEILSSHDHRLSVYLPDIKTDTIPPKDIPKWQKIFIIYPSFLVLFEGILFGSLSSY
jgi:hypothetical protein